MSGNYSSNVTEDFYPYVLQYYTEYIPFKIGQLSALDISVINKLTAEGQIIV